MKSTYALLLSAVCILSQPLCAGSSPSAPPVKEDADPKCDKSPNCQVCKKKRDAAIAMEGNRYDNRLSNEANRAAENGNVQREQELENREQNAEDRQDQREDDESIRTDGRR